MNAFCLILAKAIHVRKPKLLLINQTAKDVKGFFLKDYNIPVILNKPRNRNFWGGSKTGNQRPGFYIRFAIN